MCLCSFRHEKWLSSIGLSDKAYLFSEVSTTYYCFKGVFSLFALCICYSCQALGVLGYSTFWRQLVLSLCSLSLRQLYSCPLPVVMLGQSFFRSALQACVNWRLDSMNVSTSGVQVEENPVLLRMMQLVSRPSPGSTSRQRVLVSCSQPEEKANPSVGMVSSRTHRCRILRRGSRIGIGAIIVVSDANRDGASRVSGSGRAGCR